VLPARDRLTSSDEFSFVVRRGRRAGRPRLVVHAWWPDLSAGGDRAGGRAPAARDETTPTRRDPPRVGFVVSKAVGRNAVVRHRVARRLRHLMRERLAGLPAGTLVVVRALPPAANAPSRELGADLDAAFRKLRVFGAGAEHPPTGSQ